MPHDRSELAGHIRIPFSERKWKMVNYGLGILKCLAEGCLIGLQRIELGGCPTIEIPKF